MLLAALAASAFLLLLEVTAVAATSAPPDSSFSSPHADDLAYLEVILTFRYGGVIDTYVSVLTDGVQVYLPMRGLFSLLRIPCEIDEEAGRVHGYVASDRSRYDIDLGARTARIGNEVYPFADGDLVVSDGEVFVVPTSMREWFGLDFDFDPGEMALSLHVDEDLPVTAMNRRRAQRPDVYDPYAVIQHAPLAYDRLRRSLGGGTLDYGFAVSQDRGGTFVNLDLAAGAELLGGELEWRGAAGHVRAPYVRQNDFMWRYVHDAEDLSQIRVGTSYSTAIDPVAYHGIHLTNVPAESQTFFAEYQVTGEAPPEWDVEVYLDDRLVGLARTDASGRYRFTVPIFYGTSMLRVKTFGPSGEETQELQRLQIPFALLPPGETRYNVHAGIARNSSRLMAQWDLGYGLTERTSVTAGVDISPKFEPLGAGRRRAVGQTPLPYARLTSRVGRHYIASLDLSPGGLNRVSFSGFLPSHASVELQGVRFARTSSLFTDGRRHMVRVGGFIPFIVGDHPASIRVSAARTSFDNAAEYNIGTSLFGAFGRLRMHFDTRADLIRRFRRFRISPAASYTISERDHAMLRPLSGILVTARADYEAGLGRLERLRLDASHNIRPHCRLSVTLDAGLNGAPTAVGFRLAVDLPAARASSSAQMRGRSSSMTHSLRGSVILDEPNGTLHFDRRPVVGRSSAAVRLFVDENGNGRYDDAEKLVEEDAVSLRTGSGGYKQTRGGVALLSGLLPYTRYTATVQDVLLSNPMLVPARSAFSFIADPNSVKPLDIPLTTAGVIEGRIMRLEGEMRSPVAGATVRVVRRDDGDVRLLRTYSDGTYYEMGLPPGTYDVMAEDGVGSKLIPASRTVTIEPVLEGKVIGGLDFVIEGDTADSRLNVGSLVP